VGIDERPRDDGSVKRQGRYTKVTIGKADDYENADGVRILSFAQAQRMALADQPHKTHAHAFTVADAIASYVAWLKVHRATGHGVEQRAALHILPALGEVRVVDLTTDLLNKWRDRLAQSPALYRSANGAPKRNHKPEAKTDARARKVSANKCVTILKASLNQAFTAGLVDDDKVWRRF
jgi:hypothetical protein